jgi:hypothetical protein
LNIAIKKLCASIDAEAVAMLLISKKSLFGGMHVSRYSEKFKICTNTPEYTNKKQAGPYIQKLKCN